ncbi:hypothetical protein KGP36_06520 [Patescibacteria group bacterium]|nr:hypothetical protein [Patescibacteria group bacterium]
MKTAIERHIRVDFTEVEFNILLRTLQQTAFTDAGLEFDRWKLQTSFEDVAVDLERR